MKTDKELRDEFDKKCMNCSFYKFKDIDEAYDYVVDYIGTFGTFKWGYELAQETIKAKDAEIESLKSAYSLIANANTEKLFEIEDKDKAIAEARELINKLLDRAEIDNDYDDYEKAKEWLESNK